MADSDISIGLPGQEPMTFPAGTPPEVLKAALDAQRANAAKTDAATVTPQAPAPPTDQQPAPPAFDPSDPLRDLRTRGARAILTGAPTREAAYAEPPLGQAAPAFNLAQQGGAAVPQGPATLPYDWATAPDWAKQAYTGGQQYAQGAVSNFGDEAAAALRATFPSLSNYLMRPSAFEQTQGVTVPDINKVSGAPTWNQRYLEELAKTRNALDIQKAAYPTTAAAANTAGLVTQGFLTPNAAALAEANTGKTLLNAAQSGLQFGAAGFGEGEGGPQARLDKAYAPAIAGMLFGGAGQAFSPYIEPAAQRVGEFLSRGGTRVAGALGRFVPDAAPNVMQQAVANLPEVSGFVGPRTPPPNVNPLATASPQAIASAQVVAGDLQRSGRYGDIATPEGIGSVGAALDQRGDSATLAGIDHTLESRARDAYTMGGAAPDVMDASLAASKKQQGAILRTAIGETKPIPQLEEEALAAQQAAGPRIYDPVLRGNIPLNVSTDMQVLRNFPEVQAAEQRAILSLRQLPQNATNPNYVPTPAEVAHRVTTELENAKSPLADTWQGALHGANDHIRAADQAYAQLGGVGREIEGAKGWMRGGLSDEAQAYTPYVLQRDAPLLTAAEQQGRQQAARAAMVEPTKDIQGTRALARKLQGSDPEIGITARLHEIDPQRLPEVMRQSEGITNFAQMEQAVARRSPERPQDIGRALVGEGGSIGGQIFGWLKSRARELASPNAALRAELGSRLVSTDPAVQAETLALARALAARRTAMGGWQGGLAGAGAGSSEGLAKLIGP
jgi:hypothetical protein